MCPSEVTLLMNGFSLWVDTYLSWHICSSFTNTEMSSCLLYLSKFRLLPIQALLVIHAFQVDFNKQHTQWSRTNSIHNALDQNKNISHNSWSTFLTSFFHDYISGPMFSTRFQGTNVPSTFSHEPSGGLQPVCCCFFVQTALGVET